MLLIIILLLKDVFSVEILVRECKKRKQHKKHVFFNDKCSLLINHYLENDFNGYSRRFVVGTPHAEQQQEQEEQEKHKDMPRYTLISPSGTHARNTNTNANTKHDFPVGVRKRITPPNLQCFTPRNKTSKGSTGVGRNSASNF